MDEKKCHGMIILKKMVMVSAEKSACKRLQVGCILVDDNHRILAHGYNGFLPKCPHESIVRDNHEQATVHAGTKCNFLLC